MALSSTADRPAIDGDVQLRRRIVAKTHLSGAIDDEITCGLTAIGSGLQELSLECGDRVEVAIDRLNRGELLR